MQFLFHCSVDECQFSNAYCLKNLHTLHIIRIKMFLSKHPIKNVKVRPLNPRHEARFWHGVLFTMNISGTWINILMIDLRGTPVLWRGHFRNHGPQRQCRGTIRKSLTSLEMALHLFFSMENNLSDFFVRNEKICF